MVYAAPLTELLVYPLLLAMAFSVSLVETATERAVTAAKVRSLPALVSAYSALVPVPCPAELLVSLLKTVVTPLAKLVSLESWTIIVVGPDVAVVVPYFHLVYLVRGAKV